MKPLKNPKNEVLIILPPNFMSSNYTGISYRVLMVWSVGSALTEFIDPSMQAKD